MINMYIFSFIINRTLKCYFNETLNDDHFRIRTKNFNPIGSSVRPWPGRRGGVVATSSYFPTITLYTQRQIRELSLSHSVRVSLSSSLTLKLNVTIGAQG